MKYTCEVVINAPLEQLVSLWEDDQYCGEWQDGFQSIELIEGIKNQPGAKSRILFTQRGKEMELMETIIENDLPHKKLAEYDHMHMRNTQTTTFVEINSNTTKYISEVEYLELKSWMIKLMAWVSPKMFRKMSEKWMNQFKVFAENHIADD